MVLKLENIDLSHIHEYINSGSLPTAPKEVVQYLELLDKTRGMHLRIDEFGSKDAIVNHLIQVEGLSRYLANNIYNDAMEYFYCDRNISKNAYRNILYELKHKNYLLAMQLSKDTKDVASADKILDSMAKLMELDKDDPVVIPEAAYQQPFKMYSNDSSYLGLPELNKKEIKTILSKIPELSQKELQRIEEEANLLPGVRLFLNEHEDPRKS